MKPELQYHAGHWLDSKCVTNLGILELKINVIQLVNAKFVYPLNLCIR